MVHSRKLFDKIGYGIIFVALTIIAIMCLYPIVYILAVSLSDKAAAEAGMVTIYPIGFTLSSYKRIMQDTRFFGSFFISIKRVILGGGLQFIFTSLMAFSLSRSKKEFKLRDIYMWFLIFTMIFSSGLVPYYMTIKSYGLMDSIWALVLPSAVPVYNVILLMNFFKNVPKEIDEAAKIDGAGPWIMLVIIYLPISLPALATVTLFSIVGHWNGFFDGLIFMNRTENYPLATYIQTLIVQPSLTNLSSSDIKEISKISQKTMNSAKIFVSLLPILIIYPFFQKYFVNGIMLGSVKE